MKTKTIEVCDAIFVDVTCEYNDWVDIRCGGPATLGYEFYISPDENKNQIENLIKGWLKKYDRSFMGISFSTHKNFPVKNLWTKEKMENCIKTQGF